MKKLLCTSVAAALLGGASAGNAGVLLTDLFFSQNAGFLEPTFFANDDGDEPLVFNDLLPMTDQTPIADAGVTVTPAGTVAGFNWKGANTNEDDTPVLSQIEIESFSAGTAPDAEAASGDALKFDAAFNPDGSTGEWNEGDWWVIDTLTQTNRTLEFIEGDEAPSTLWEVDALANLRIYTDSTQTELIGIDPNSATSISFWESTNFGSEAQCAGDNPLGTLCDDVFTIEQAALDPIFFVYDGYRYDFFFDLLPGDSTDTDGNALDTKSEVALNDDGTISVFTPEFNPGTSSIHVIMSYSAREVPLPSGLALFGAGLLSLGGLVRRKRA